MDVCPVDDRAGRAAGALIGRAGTEDPIDATLVLVCQSGDRLVTSDLQDLQRLADAAGPAGVGHHP